MLQRVRAVILIRIMRSLDRLSGSDQDCGDREMYIDLDDASVDSLTGKRSRHHVVGAEVFHTFFFFFSVFPFFKLSRYIIRRFHLIRERGNIFLLLYSYNPNFSYFTQRVCSAVIWPKSVNYVDANFSTTDNTNQIQRLRGTTSHYLIIEIE